MAKHGAHICRDWQAAKPAGLSTGENIDLNGVEALEYEIVKKKKTQKTSNQ